jgi:hypothetical protein
MNATDRDSLLRFYDDDVRFTWTADGKVGTRSVAQVRTAFASLAAFTRWHIEYKNPSVVAVAPGVGAVASEYTESLQDSTGKGVTFDGAMTMLLVHTPAGWKILQGHSSSAGRDGR